MADVTCAKIFVRTQIRSSLKFHPAGNVHAILFRLMQTDKDKPVQQNKPDCTEYEGRQKYIAQDDDVTHDAGILQKIRITITTALVVVSIVTVCGIIFGLVARGRFTVEYVFMANFIVAAVIIAAGLLLPATPNRVVDKLRNRQLVEYTMHEDFMQSRAAKERQGYKILWVGISCAAITGIAEIVIWLVYNV